MERKIKEAKWEFVPSTNNGVGLFRTPVPGGWLVIVQDEVMTHIEGRGILDGYEWRTSITFYPDPKHSWDIYEVVEDGPRGPTGAPLIPND